GDRDPPGRGDRPAVASLRERALGDGDRGRRLSGCRRARRVPALMRRVSVIGPSCSGKTTTSRRLAAILGVPVVQLDALHHDPGWQEAPAEVFMPRVEAALAAAPDGWVVDGNYFGKLGPYVLDRADTIVWLDVPYGMAVRRVLSRTFRRSLSREELWNGN